MRWCQSCSSSTSRGSEVDCRQGLPYPWRHEKSRGWTSEWGREREVERQRWKGWESRGREGWRESYRQGKCPRFPWCLLESETKSRSTAVRCVTDKTVNRERDSIRGYSRDCGETWLRKTSRLFCGISTEETGEVCFLKACLDSVWTCLREMYLYKATCPDIPTPKQKGLQKERGLSRCGKQNTGGKLYPPLMCLRSKSQVELKHLEEFLNVHTLSLQDSVRARTGMAYRYTHTQ